MLHDFMMSLRRIVRAPLFSLLLVAILGVGVGATATMVRVLDALLWRPVAMFQPKQLVEMTTVTADGEQRPIPLVSADRVMHAALPVDAWCAYSSPWFATRAGNRALLASGQFMSAGCIHVTRVAPRMGRWFTDAEAPVTGRGQSVAVITDRYWKRMFDRAPDIIGRSVTLDDGIVTVIGVLPASYDGFEKDVAVDIILPFAVFEPATTTWSLIGRLRPGTSIDGLRAHLAAMWPDIIKGTQPPAGAAPPQPHIESASTGFSFLRRLYWPPLGSVTTLAPSPLSANMRQCERIVSYENRLTSR